MSQTPESSLKRLRGLLSQGVVDVEDGREMAELFLHAFDLVGMVCNTDCTFEGQPFIGGDLKRWATAHAEVAHLDPTWDYLRACPAGTWYVPTFNPTGADTASDVYLAFLREEFVDVAVTRFEGPNGDSLPIAFYRDRIAGAFSPDDLQKLHQLYPIFAGALRTRTAIEALALDERGSAQPAALAAVEIGYPKGIVRWNSRARRLFQQRLGATSGQGWTRIERALHRAVVRSSVSARRQPILGGLSLEIAYLPPRNGSARTVSVLFFEERPRPVGTADPRTPAEELLSPRQRVVARLAARGFSVNAMAQELGVGPETVRHHLRNVFDRLHVRQRVDLVQLVD
ncbi:MAG: helix-turn-helix transcriptional regulator [Myxococcota bacterium]